MLEHGIFLRIFALYIQELLRLIKFLLLIIRFHNFADSDKKYV